MACRLPLLLTCALLAGAAQAAELGEPRVSSFIGQPLVADIELTMLEDPGHPVQVRLASPNVYRGAGIGMPPVLSSLTLSVMRRDGKQFLHVTSLGKVEAAHLHLYLELSDGSQRGVRLATLWLSPDPQPAPPPAPVVPPVVPVVAPAVVAKVQAAEPVRIERPAPAPVRPTAAVAAAPRKPGPVPAKPVVVPAPALAGGSCAPQVQAEPNACVALGVKNAMLREQLGQLEDKVKVLQVAVGAAPGAVAAPLKPYKPKKKKVEPPPEQGTPWLLIGGGILGLLALVAGVLLARRRKKPAKRAVAPKAGLGSRLRSRLGRKPGPGKPLEPTLEKSAHDLSTQL